MRPGHSSKQKEGKGVAETSLAAVLFDMDGTIVDSEPLWFSTEKEIAKEHGRPWTPVSTDELVGTPLMESAQVVIDATGLPLTPEEFIDEVVARIRQRILAGEAKWIPGALELMAECNEQNVPCGLVTSSYRPLADAVVSLAPAGTFAVVAAGDEVVNKPEPDPYLLAAKLLNVDIKNCVVLEDSVPGASSGLAAGAVTVGISRQLELPQLPGLHLRATMAELNLAALRQLVAAERQ